MWNESLVLEDDFVVNSETQEKLPFKKMQDDEFVPPEHLQEFESNTVDYDKTIYDMNVKEEIASLKSTINELEQKINLLNQYFALCRGSLAGLNTALVNSQYSPAINLYYPTDGQYLAYSMMANCRYIPLYQAQVQDCCNRYIGHF